MINVDYSLVYTTLGMTLRCLSGTFLYMAKNCITYKIPQSGTNLGKTVAIMSRKRL